MHEKKQEGVEVLGHALLLIYLVLSVPGTRYRRTWPWEEKRKELRTSQVCLDLTLSEIQDKYERTRLMPNMENLQYEKYSTHVDSYQGITEQRKALPYSYSSRLLFSSFVMFSTVWDGVLWDVPGK